MGEAFDPVTRPAHYELPGGGEAKDVMRQALGHEGACAYWLGCSLKYLLRYRGKGGQEDLAKAAQCVAYLAEEEYGDE